MIPHHRSAVDMAEIAKEQSNRREIKTLADAGVEIPHHQAAIRMARAELEQGQNRELNELAEAIVDAQAKEIDEMNTWRVEWFGKMSPAGGVPSEEDSGSGHGGGHGM